MADEGGGGGGGGLSWGSRQYVHRHGALGRRSAGGCKQPMWYPLSQVEQLMRHVWKIGWLVISENVMWYSLSNVKTNLQKRQKITLKYNHKERSMYVEFKGR